MFIFIAFDISSVIGWMAGSFASAVNFGLMAFHTESMVLQGGKAGSKRASKSFVFRYLFLILWSIFVLIVIKPNVMTYCLGLLASQLSIILYHIYSSIMNSKYKKYFRGDDE